MKSIILAAGRGERMKPLTDNLPKPLLPIGDKPLLWYNLKLLKMYGINEVGINTSYMSEKIKELIGDGSELGMKISYSFESELLGTSGALNNFRDFLDESFFVIYGDNLTDLNLNKMNCYHRNKLGIATLFLRKETMFDKTTTPGVVIVNDEFEVKEILERPSQEDFERIRMLDPKNWLNNSGLYLFEPEVLDYIPTGSKSDFAMEVFPEMLDRSEKIYGFTENCFYRELGSMERYLLTKEDFDNEKIKLNI